MKTKKTKVEEKKLPTVVITSDHSGVLLKKEIADYLLSKGVEVTVLGSNSGTAPDDYPDFVVPMAERILNFKNTVGIAICGTGIGISIAASKIKGIYPALCASPEIAFFARTHNDANVLVLGARYTARNTALKIVDVFLETPFEGGRHERRLKKILDIENGTTKPEQN